MGDQTEVVESHDGTVSGLVNAIKATMHRLLGKSSDRELVPENAAEYEAAANGHRLL